MFSYPKVIGVHPELFGVKWALRSRYATVIVDRNPYRLPDRPTGKAVQPRYVF